MVVGQRVRPDSWEERTSGTAAYATDVRRPGMLAARVLRSPHPHAEIRSVDAARARALDGVAAVVTAADLPDPDITYLHLGEPFRDRTVLARDRVRFVSEEVAAVAAETPEAAEAALGLIEVDYARLPAAFDPEQARRPGAAPMQATQAQSRRPRFRRRPGAVPIHAHAPDNSALKIDRTYGDFEGARSRAAATVAGAYRYRPAAHLCMEPHSVVAEWDPAAERMDLWVSTQAPWFVRKEVAHMLGLDMDQVHTHPVAVGGGFGAKAKAGAHEAIAAALSVRTGRPVRLVLDRAEEFAATATRHPFHIVMSTGAAADGALTHRDCSLTVDNGAYNHAGPSVAVFATMLAANLYRLRGSRARAELVYTNKQPGASFRGYGNPQMTFAMESQLDELADELGIDRAEMRIRNANRAGDETLTGWQLGSARLVECLERARDEIGWEAKQGWAGTGRGVGMAAAVHVSGANAFEHSELSEAAVEVHADGAVEVCFAGADAGTGQAALLRQIAAAELGVDFDDVSVTMMDSQDAPPDLGAWSSRGTMWSGHSVGDAAGRAARVLAEAAAAKFGVDASEVTLAGGEARAGGEAIDIGDLVALVDPEVSGRLRAEGCYLTDVDKMDKATGRGHFSPAYSFCVQAVEVEVDPDTNQVRVTDAVSVHDSGAVLNPAGAEGQVAGAVVMGLGAALGEELVHEGGRLVNPSYLEYAAPRAGDMPAVRAVFLAGADPAGPYGAKGLGEIGVVPTPAAVANAVAHATGVRVRELPITPDKLRGWNRSPVRPRPIGLRPSRWWTAAVRWLYPRGLHRALHHWGAERARVSQPARAPVTALDRPATAEAAAAAHAPGAAYLAGGTDLLVARDQGVASPVRLIDLSTVRSLRELGETDDGDLRIGSGTTLADLRRFLSGESGEAAPGDGPAADSAPMPEDRADGVNSPAPGDRMLVELLDGLATPQIREMATVGGNLLQQKRCSFYRNGFNCYKRGGWTCPCYAVLGEHRFHHAVIGAHRCQAVTPSDLAVGLLALDADFHSSGPGPRQQEAPIGGLYQGPGESTLAPGELLTAVTVPAGARRRRSAFEKLAKYAGDFAVCSAAVSLDIDEDGVIGEARVALGAVAPVPYRAARTEDRLRGRRLDDAAELDQAAEAWARDAHPLGDNAWKIDAACGLIRRALRRLGDQ